MDQVRIGIVGIGNMGSAHARNIYAGKVEGLKLTAVCDISEDRLAWAEEAVPEAERFTDYRKLIASGLADAVLVATPHRMHPVVAEAAMEAGLHVLTEKPAGVASSGVRRMNAIAERTGVVFGIMYNQRTNPIFRKMREIVKSGELGELKRSVWIVTNWYRTQAYYDSGSWRASWNGEGGGVLLNQCPHNLDIWQWIVGLPRSIRAFCGYGKYHDIDVEDDVTMYAEYEGGATGVFITTTGEYPGTNRLEITGDRGKLVAENGKLTYWKLAVPEREVNRTSEQGFVQIPMEEIEIPITEKETAHLGILQNFTNAILKGEELIAPGVDGINALQIINAAHLSDWTDDWADIPVDDELFDTLLAEHCDEERMEQRRQAEKSHETLRGEYSERWSVRW